jgi:hypothetical protein
MKSITTKTVIDATTASSSYPAIFFGSNLLQSGYDVINDVIINSAGGGGDINLTKQNINEVDSFNPLSGKLGRPLAKFGDQNFTPLDPELSGAIDSIAQGLESASFRAPDLDKIAISGTSTEVVTAKDFFSTQTFTRDLATNTVNVVTDATISGGGGGSASNVYSDEVKYAAGGKNVTVSGNGYKKRLSESETNIIEVEFMRVQLINFSDQDIEDFLSQEAYIIEAEGQELKKIPFTLMDHISPRHFRHDIVDILMPWNINGNRALILQPPVNSGNVLKTTFFYK